MNVTIPPLYFNKRSFVEQFAMTHGYAPVFLEKASQSNNILTQIKYTTTFFLASTLMFFFDLK